MYDGLNVIIERDPSDVTRAYYTKGLSYGGGIGGIISKRDSSGTYYYHYDGIGAVGELTDSEGQVIQQYTYDAYGNILSSSGSVTNPYQFSTKEYSAVSGLIYFGARYYDPKVGRFITKDPWTWGPDDPRILNNLTVTGRFLAIIVANNNGIIPQPFLDSQGFVKEFTKFIILSVGAANPEYFHGYMYVSNNPVNWTDPFGLSKSWGEKLKELWQQITAAVKTIVKTVADAILGVPAIGTAEVGVELTRTIPKMKDHYRDTNKGLTEDASSEPFYYRWDRKTGEWVPL